MALLIKNGTVVDPENKLHDKLDLLVENGEIAKVAKNIKAPEAKEIDAAGLIVAPGFIDMHVHLREPGREDTETIESGSWAAAAGGFTSVVCMPNTSPVNDNAAVTKFILDRAREKAVVNVFAAGAITRGSEGESLAEIGEMVAAGVLAITDDGKPVMNAQVMRRAMEYCRIFEIPIIDHCEDKFLSAKGAMNEGYHSTVLGLRGISNTAEEVHVARDIILAELTGVNVHIAHLSTKGSVALVGEAKNRGIGITAEATPHHFALTDAAVRGYDTNTKMNPPLRSEEDSNAIIQGLADGTIDAIASDHAPHSVEEKMLEYDKAPFGIVGLETAVHLAIDKLVNSGHIKIEHLVKLMSTNPARIIKLNKKGSLSIGSDADITILDLGKKITVDVSTFHSKSRNSPFHGWNLSGAAVMTIVKGKVVWRAD